MFFVLAQCAILKTLQTAQEDIDQVILKPVILMSDKGEEMKIAIFLLATGQLKDLGFDDAVGIVLDAVLVERQFIQYGFERLIKSFNQSKIARALFHFGRLGRL